MDSRDSLPSDSHLSGPAENPTDGSSDPDAMLRTAYESPASGSAVAAAGPRDGTVIVERPAGERPTAGRRALEAFKGLAVLVLAGVLFLVASIVMTAAAALLVVGEFDLAQLRNPDVIQRTFESRLGLLLVVVLPQFALVAPPVLAALLSSQSTRRRLGLVRGRWPLPVWAAAAVAAPLVGMVSGVIVSMFFEQSAQLEEMSEIFRGHGQSGFLIPLALMIGATPAICEELLFRGYLQNRLCYSFGPLLGILFASLAFAVFHMDFVHVVAVFPLGLFLGWVTWHSGSLIPAMLAHFVNNVVSVVAVVLAPEGEPDMLALPGALFALAIFSLGLLGLATVTITAWVYGRPERTPQRA